MRTGESALKAVPVRIGIAADLTMVTAAAEFASFLIVLVPEQDKGSPELVRLIRVLHTFCFRFNPDVIC